MSRAGRKETWCRARCGGRREIRERRPGAAPRAAAISSRRTPSPVCTRQLVSPGYRERSRAPPLFQRCRVRRPTSTGCSLALEIGEGMRPGMQAADLIVNGSRAGSRPVERCRPSCRSWGRRSPVQSSCGVSVARPSAIASTAATRAPAPSRARSCSTSLLVSSPPIGRNTFAIIGPASSCLDDPHDRDACLGLAGHDRPVNRRGPSVRRAAARRGR